MKKTEKRIVKDQENYMSLYESFLKNDQIPFIIDGQNFAFSLKRKFQKDGLISLINLISLLNHPIFLILPNFLINRYELNNEFLKENNTSLVRIDNHSKDDWGILDLANRFNGFIISNDNYRQFRTYYPKELFSGIIEFVTFSIDEKVLITIPFIEFIKLQNKNYANESSVNHDKAKSPSFGALSS